MKRIRKLAWPTILLCAVGTTAPGRCDIATSSEYSCQPLSLIKLHRSGGYTPSTSAFLQDRGLLELARRRPQEAFSVLERCSAQFWPEPQRLLALAELAYWSSQAFPRKEAVAWARDAAVYSTFYLAEPIDSCRDDSSRSLAQAIHNLSLRRCLRLVRTEVPPIQSAWPNQLGQLGIVVTSTTNAWAALGIDSLEITERSHFLRRTRTGPQPGLGIPVIAHRKFTESDLPEWKPYGPREAAFAATALLHPRESSAGWRDQPVELVLVDPLQFEAVEVGRERYTLGKDLTTPLEIHLAQSPMRYYELLGVISAGLYTAKAGVYAVDPYQHGKVPVVFVQGLWSEPAVWVPMLDELRKDATLRATCQFWVALYPSGHPLPLAAQSLRHSLREIRQKFDPGRVDPALDQMVIVGKSTGGQVVKMLASPSGDAIWNAVFARPFDQVQAHPELRALLADAFFFEPEPYVRRVIFLSTGHRGSKLANQPGMRLGVELIRRNNPLRQACLQLEAANGPLVFQPFFRNRAPSSIDGMQLNDPLLIALAAQPISPQITFHSIIANNRRGWFITPKEIGDGLVSYSSAHLDGAVSECIVQANHMCEADPEVISEVKRILTVHVYACPR
jgi:hypothetical protein